MPEIFISYAREDRSRVEPLAVCLERHGWTVFWDRKIHTGAQWHDVISKALEEAERVIVVWSSYSLVSDFVRDEAAAGQARKVLVPILLDGVLPPLGFRQIQAADLSDWQGAEDAPALQQLLRDLGAPRARSGSSIPSATLPGRPQATPKGAAVPKFAALGAGAVLVVVLALLIGRSLTTARPKPAAPAAAESTVAKTVPTAATSGAVQHPPLVPPATTKTLEPGAEHNQLLKTLRPYFHDLNAGEFDAQRYFANDVSLYISMKNPSRAALNHYFGHSFPALYRNYRVEMLEDTIARKGPRVFVFRETSHFNEVAKQNRHRDIVAEDRVTLDEEGKIIRFEQTYISG